MYIHNDSPIAPTFPRRLSEPIAVLAAITERSKHQRKYLYSSLLSSPSSAKTNRYYTFFHSSSRNPSPQSSHFPSADLVFSPRPREPSSPSSRSLPIISDKNEFDFTEDLWNEGWDIVSVNAMDEEVKLLEAYNLPTIREDEFMYYPGPIRAPVTSHWSDDEDEENLRLVRGRRFLERMEYVSRGSRVRCWFRGLLKKLNVGGRQCSLKT
ncbi:hypothetical protein GQ44DRAFT_700269 [Phaeosphaeriaceae sp. PMI808]|nr:hypothetical protein GQ44DRAFT_700269 [Phaeosphaeriaceae sp. PMI808]